VGGLRTIWALIYAEGGRGARESRGRIAGPFSRKMPIGILRQAEGVMPQSSSGFDDVAMTDHLLTQADYARHRGVSRQAIGKAVRLKKIPVHLVGGCKLIDPAEADFALGVDIARLSDQQPIEQISSVRGGSKPDGLTAARTENERYKTKMLELLYRKRMGELVELSDVKNAVQVLAASLVEVLERIPTERAQFLSGGGVIETRIKLKAIIREARIEVSQAYAKVVEDIAAAGNAVPSPGELVTELED
jgi:hypothetical protein